MNCLAGSRTDRRRQKGGAPGRAGWQSSLLGHPRAKFLMKMTREMKTNKCTRILRAYGRGAQSSSSSARQALRYALSVLPYGQHRASLRACPHWATPWGILIVADEKELLTPNTRKPAAAFLEGLARSLRRGEPNHRSAAQANRGCAPSRTEKRPARAPECNQTADCTPESHLRGVE